MMRLILAPESTNEIEEKLIKSQSQESRQNTFKITKMKNGAAHEETRFNPKHGYIEANQIFTRCENHPNILPLFERLGRSLTSLISSLRHEAHLHLSKKRL
jgi:hypothetical protein